MSEGTNQSGELPGPKKAPATNISRRTIIFLLVGAAAAEAIASGTTWQEFVHALQTASLVLNLTFGQFGSLIHLGKKKDFPYAQPKDFKIGKAGVFYIQSARTYLVHLAPNTHFLLSGTKLQNQLSSESFVKDSDGSLWVALYQRCVHLGCTYAFRDDCVSFKCPCHGSHYNVDGEYLDGPAPRSLDRFALYLFEDSVIMDTVSLNNKVPHPDDTTRIIPMPEGQCST